MTKRLTFKVGKDTKEGTLEPQATGNPISKNISSVDWKDTEGFIRLFIRIIITALAYCTMCE